MLALLVAAVLLSERAHFPYDDASISYRYARNFAEGHGLDPGFDGGQQLFERAGVDLPAQAKYRRVWSRVARRLSNSRWAWRCR
ncbi:hypothetical protein ENSA5_43550 [Enhygromyxa salina]|uniref:Uncharacterized protein n=1 Tax=Enhygromyxa salina TaxID=215803 RepID=A0A2S9XKJ9_9BACT|nr:hypothetical protein ENSA5_43550 [Enhygromyxa salina]